MPRLTNNSLASLPGTDFSFPPVTSDDLSPASSSRSTTSVAPSGADVALSSSSMAAVSTSPLPVLVPSSSTASSAWSSSLTASSGPSSGRSLESHTWLPIPYQPPNPWPTSGGVPPTATSAISPPNVLNLRPSFSSPSSAVRPPFCFPPVSSQVMMPAPPVNTIRQQASTCQDPILQEAMTRERAQAQATLQAQAMLQASAQAHANAVAQVQARGRELASVARLPAAPGLPSSLSLAPSQGCSLDPSPLSNPLINPLAAGVPVPGMLLPSARAQPASFVVGPGFLPISDKMVSNIVSGQYIDLAALLAKPSEVRSTSPLICVDGQVVVSTAPKPPRRLTDIAQWLQAFAIYMLVMVTYAPHRAADLIRYQLLILRTHSQFGGLAWYNYDEAFRRDAAARQVVDWSGMHVELYNFHTASTSRVVPTSSGPLSRESAGAQFGTTICRSWNLGRCVASRAVCRYLHVCDVPRCRAGHRRIHCPIQASGAPAGPLPATTGPVGPPLSTPPFPRPRDR